MTYRKLLKHLRKQARSDGMLDEDVTIENLLDDLAVIGLDGASDLYIKSLQPHDIDSSAGRVSER